MEVAPHSRIQFSEIFLSMNSRETPLVRDHDLSAQRVPAAVSVLSHRGTRECPPPGLCSPAVSPPHTGCKNGSPCFKETFSAAAVGSCHHSLGHLKHPEVGRAWRWQRPSGDPRPREDKDSSRLLLTAHLPVVT